MSATNWTPLLGLKEYALKLGRKLGLIALAWIPIYFISQVKPEGIGVLFMPLLGALAGLVIGWWLAENAVEDAGFSGPLLWLILVAASWIVPWSMEGLLWLLTRWELGFGRWMLLVASTVFSLAAAVWRASADD